jgi:hypothetical protein
MSIEHVSRSGKRYYLHTKPRKNGKPDYFFSLQNEGPMARTVPEGYEVYENVRGQVFLRRLSKKLISEEEQGTVTAALIAHAEEWRYKTEIKKNTIVVYEASDNQNDVASIFPWVDSAKLKAAVIRNANYLAVLRFVLVDPVRRRFAVERFCFRGSVDDWIPVGREAPSMLSALARKYVKYLGTDSIYELF